jgi:tRNA(Ser,Leu) C12 N-acetylase TAN1
MQEWNVIVTVRDFKQACDLLAAFGRVKRSDFYNTLTMNVEDIHQFLEILHINSSDNIEYLNPVSRLIPVTHTFSFQSPVEFESKLKEKALTWVNELEGKGFYVRMRRRGFKGKLSSFKEEQFLDGLLLEELEKAGIPGHITFENPDAVITVETIANRAGLSLWSREQLQRYPFIRVD